MPYASLALELWENETLKGAIASKGEVLDLSYYIDTLTN